uniref:EamA domain-containing protein n=1 Tax=viral metagenome TaxID=1070528 RepID=A0A6C0HKD4_9ZZZZ
MPQFKDFIDTAFIARFNWKWGSFSFLPIAFGVAMALVDVVMMFVSKLVHLGKIPYAVGLPLAMAAYTVQPYLFIKGMNYEGMAVMNLIWNLSSNFIITLAGVFLFKESIRGLRWLAILMSVFSLGLFAYTGGE